MTEEKDMCMRRCYENFFKIFLEMCKNPKNLDTTELLKDRIKTTERLSHELMGMLTLMQSMGAISGEEYGTELDRVIREFSSIELFGALIGYDGEVWSFGEVHYDT